MSINATFEPAKQMLQTHDNQRFSPFDEALATLDGVEMESEDTTAENDIRPFDPVKINIETRPMTVGQLIARIRDNEASDGHEGILLRPDFQRLAGIWKDEAQSRLIESMMIRIPLPVFYLNEDNDFSDLWIVIDGLQRLTTIKRFVVEKTLRLKNLEFWKEFEGKTYDELPRVLQRRIEETQVMVYLVKKGTPDQVKFNIFNRINTGGVPLTTQEIRHALNLGPATELLQELAESEAFLQATDRGVGTLRMADRECVLRFFAFQTKSAYLREMYGMRDYMDYSGRDDLDTFLNEQMKRINILGKKEPAHLKTMRAQFTRTMQAAYALFGMETFRKPSGSSGRYRVSKALLEVWTVKLDQRTDQELELLQERKKMLRGKFVRLMDDSEFIAAISYGTGTARRVKYRFEQIGRIIQETIDHV
jgi:hypothetical protein